MDPSVVIVIPAFNEADRISNVLAGLPRSLPGFRSIRPLVVDDGSSDATGDLARSADALVVRHRVNLGYGAALLTGSEAAVRSGADIVVHMDADGQHAVEDLPRLLEPVRLGADAAVGLRPFAKPMPLLTRVGNRFLSFALRRLFGVTHPDSQCGFRAFRASKWPALRWESRDYAISSEILARSQRHGVRWTSVPIRTIYLDAYKGTGVGDGFRILGKLLHWRLGA